MAQGSAGDGALFQSQRIVDMPTAGILPRNEVLIRGIAFEQGGILGEVLFSPWTNFQLGIGGTALGVIGTQTILLQGIPSVVLRWRLLDETLTLPAVAIGFETLGRGFLQNYQFEIPAPGAYLVASKQFRWFLGGCSVHAGVGYSFDLRLTARYLNGWVGFEQSLGRSIAVSTELNPLSLERGQPLLMNILLRWSVVRGGTVELYLRDLLAHHNARSLRWFGVEFIGQIGQVFW